MTEILTAVVAVAGSLAGVALGSRMNRKAMKEEREAAQRAGLVKDASEVLGIARVVLTAMEPQQYALWASPGLGGEIQKRRTEADAIRPRLAALAVRWRDASDELNSVERHLGITPTRLRFLVEAVLHPEQNFTEMLADRKGEHDATVAALDRAIECLHSSADSEDDEEIE